MKTQKGAETQLYSVWTSVFDGGGSSTKPSGRFNPGNSHFICYRRGWVGSRDGREGRGEERIPYLQRGRTWTVKPIRVAMPTELTWPLFLYLVPNDLFSLFRSFVRSWLSFSSNFSSIFLGPVGVSCSDTICIGETWVENGPSIDCPEVSSWFFSIPATVPWVMSRQVYSMFLPLHYSATWTLCTAVHWQRL